MDTQDLIPKFFLYGEHRDHDDSEFVHIESIAARSEKAQWNIKPHHHGKLFQLLFIIQGSSDIYLDNKDYVINGNGAVIIPASVVHGFTFSPQTQGYVLTIAEPLINQSANSRAVDFLNFVTLKARVLHFKQDSQFLNQLVTYLDTMLEEFQSFYSGKRYSIEWLVKMTLMTLYREIETHEEIENSRNINPKLYLFNNLIEANFRQQWPVSLYADTLGISVSTLNRLCHNEKGDTAKQIINERMFIEAKRYLIYTQANIDQVAYRLGFEDPAYFSRFFKNKSGLSPKKFRDINPFETQY
ncbi:helix-turn-helix domain-containing protein [Vibrio sp. DW001]|uniref:helix-turn-helix domain-containing protein n=1 Tax=Vibrio sp. DW001 TaxID=2912315 RepID=UPI0023B10FBE|nr:helix-turn-helix domain-containing protein [Vibrio sp. DW001]WED28800.1 helix-turn-helix domain-containing protein [Vibrio sp. DW001]